MENLTPQEIVERTRVIIKRFEQVEGKPWGAEGGTIELMKQVGELSRLVMGQEGYYFKNRDKLDAHYLVTKEKIGDELADILYIIIRLADHYQIDLFDAHLKALDEAEKSFTQIDNIN